MLTGFSTTNDTVISDDMLKTHTGVVLMSEKMKAAVFYENKDVRIEERDVKPVE